MESFENYILSNYPHIKAEYDRYSTPFYYEPHPDVIYTNVDGSTRKRARIDNADYYLDGRMDIYLVDVDTPNETRRFVYSNLEIHKKWKRVDETILPKGIPIPNSKRIIYVKVGDKYFTVVQAYWRHHQDNRLGGRVIVYNTEDENLKNAPHFEFYSYFGSKWNLKTVSGYDSISREYYDIKFNVSVREFKKRVFGSPDVKIRLI